LFPRSEKPRRFSRWTVSFGCFSSDAPSWAVMGDSKKPIAILCHSRVREGHDRLSEFVHREMDGNFGIQVSLREKRPSNRDRSIDRSFLFDSTSSVRVVKVIFVRAFIFIVVVIVDRSLIQNVRSLPRLIDLSLLNAKRFSDESERERERERRDPLTFSVRSLLSRNAFHVVVIARITVLRYV